MVAILENTLSPARDFCTLSECCPPAAMHAQMGDCPQNQLSGYLVPPTRYYSCKTGMYQSQYNAVVSTGVTDTPLGVSYSVYIFSFLGLTCFDWAGYGCG